GGDGLPAGRRARSRPGTAPGPAAQAPAHAQPQAQAPAAPPPASPPPGRGHEPRARWPEIQETGENTRRVPGMLLSPNAQV
ncbi:hypothetical protein, partial [Streptomyces sp. DT18]